MRHRRHPLRVGVHAVAAAAWLVLELGVPEARAQTSARPSASASSAPAARRALPTVFHGLRNGRFVYRAESKRLSEVLQDFAASQNLPAVVGDGVEGIVNANFDTTPPEFLSAVSKAYGIIWYNDGSALYFYPARAIQSRLFRLKGYNRKELNELLTSLDLGDRRYPLKFDDAQHTLLVSGPPRHLELIASAIDSLDAGAAEGNEKVVRVFALHFASAADRTMGDTMVPGITSTLRSLYGHEAELSGGGDSAATSSMAQKMKALQGVTGGTRLVPEMSGGMPDSQGNQGGQGGKGASAGGQRGLRSPVNFDDDQPVFVADQATNSVIVQGRAYRMHEYEALVRRLDQRPVLVELEATIIDVSADNAESLGIDWSLQNSNGTSFGVASPDPGVPTAGGLAGLLGSGTYGITTVIGDASRQLLARVNALAGEGKARVVSKPSVLGSANRTAVMKQNQIATVRVAGNLEASLYQVEAGTMLQVTPEVTTEGGVNEIKLSLYIEDGSFDVQTVDQVPIVKKTEIRTEAQVREGESLLVGGLTIEADTQQEAGVPGLRSLPLVGALFRWNGSRTTRTERIFMITPRLIGVAPATAAATPAAPGAVVSNVSADDLRNARGDVGSIGH